MLFVITCHDKPGALDIRAANREDHLGHLRAAGDRLKLAGPFLDADGDPAGSLLVYEAADKAEAEGFAAADPYRKAGVFAEVTVKGFRGTLGAWVP